MKTKGTRNGMIQNLSFESFEMQIKSLSHQTVARQAKTQFAEHYQNVGAVGTISAFRPQGPQFDSWLCQDLN